MVKVGIVGSTGYAGAELVRLLLGHKEAQIVWYGSKSYVEEKYANVYRNFFQLVEDDCLEDKLEDNISVEIIENKLNKRYDLSSDKAKEYIERASAIMKEKK